MDKQQLAEFASKSGFGGNQRNTFAVRLELFAGMVEAATEERVRREMRGGYDEPNETFMKKYDYQRDPA